VPVTVDSLDTGSDAEAVEKTEVGRAVRSELLDEIVLPTEFVTAVEPEADKDPDVGGWSVEIELPGGEIDSDETLVGEALTLESVEVTVCPDEVVVDAEVERVPTGTDNEGWLAAIEPLEEVSTAVEEEPDGEIIAAELLEVTLCPGELVVDGGPDPIDDELVVSTAVELASEVVLPVLVGGPLLEELDSVGYSEPSTVVLKVMSELRCEDTLMVKVE
jgi:hypothetical protein